jgi:hypothetical protein
MADIIIEKDRIKGKMPKKIKAKLEGQEKEKAKIAKKLKKSKRQ